MSRCASSNLQSLVQMDQELNEISDDLGTLHLKQLSQNTTFSDSTTGTSFIEPVPKVTISNDTDSPQSRQKYQRPRHPTVATCMRTQHHLAHPDVHEV